MMLRSLDRPTTTMEKEKQLVIKVSYGETLRRFSVSFNGTGSLELDMIGLRTKIFNLFKFAPDVDLTLTYVDEDGDRVTLVDDSDLHDAIKQHLNPLRILVSLNSDRAKVFDMSGGSTALRSFSNNSLGCIPLARPTCPPLPQLPSFPMGVRPFNPSMPLISRDLASGIPSSTRADTLPHPTFPPFLRPPSASKGVRPFNPSMPPIPRDLVSSTPSSTKHEILAKQRIFSRPSIITGTAPESYHDYTCKLTGSVSMVPPPPPPKFCQFAPSRSQASCDLVSNTSSSIKNADALGLANQIEMASKKVYNDSEKSEDSKTTNGLKTLKNMLSAPESLLKGDDMNLEVNSVPSSSSTMNSSNPQNVAKVDLPQNTAKVDISFPHMFCFNNGKIPQKEYKDYQSSTCVSICGSPSLSTALGGKDLPENLVAHQLNDSVTGQMGPSASNTDTPSTALRGKDLPENLVAHQLNDSVTGQMAQSASNTDPACFMHPQRVNGVWISLPGLNLAKPTDAIQSMSEMGRSVTRPPKRINSKEMGEILHLGIRCDGCGLYPIAGPRFKSKVKVDYDLCSICFAALGNEEDYTRLVFPIYYKSRLPKFPSSQVTRPLLLSNNRWKCRPKLDSRFVKDVNIFDGTIMPPSTSFTKIWRMQNNGADSWPRGTQLICMGEDWLTNLASFELELPDKGCPVGMHYNVAIDLTAPELPGYYGSYWRMASPSGDKFGQCIWVIIQVDASLEDTECGIQNLNLNLPPDSVDVKKEIIDLNDELVNASTQSFYTYKLDSELMKPGVNENPSKEVQAMHGDFLIHPAVFAGKPLRDFDTSTILESARVADSQTLLGEVSDEINLEQSLLMDLEDMGFKEIGLNREILRANNYDLSRSLDDLCSVPNWDFLLEELQQMGFPDKETNRRLLVKNGGSIKRVVKELLDAEKA